MKDRELIYRFGLVAFVVGCVLLAAILAGRADLGPPLLALAWWLSLPLVIRPHVYERHGKRIGDWAMLILVLGPLAIIAAPLLWWEHRNLRAGT